MFEKIVIGTAQFGDIYGITNSVGKVQRNEIEKILSSAWDLGINKIDTAQSYGDAEILLGSFNLNAWDIYSKIHIHNCKINDIYPSIKKKVENSIKNLKVQKLKSVLLHSPDEISKHKEEEIFNSMTQLQKENYFDHFGVSFYLVNDLLDLTKNRKLDIVQVPMSIFDHRYNNSLRDLKEKKIIKLAQVRSIFLQGLALVNPNDIQIKFKKWLPVFSTFHEWCNSHNLKPVQACLNHFYNRNYVDQIVVGFHSKSHFDELIQAIKTLSETYPRNLNSTDESLLIPSNWENL